MRATFSGEELEVIFAGNSVCDVDGCVIEDIHVLSVSLLGHDLPFHSLSEALQASILALADDIEWP